MQEVTLNRISINESLPTRDVDQSSERLGHIWRVIGQKSDHGGQIYQFQLKEEYRGNSDLYLQKKDELFPAMENNFTTFSHSPLGYSFNGETTDFRWEVPDKTSLEARFEKYRVDHPELPLRSLKILSSEGIANDSDFAKAYIGNDALLSNGIEFIHDQQFHVIRMLEMLLRNPNGYYAKKQQAEVLITRANQRFEKLKTANLMTPLEIQKLELILGAFVDVLWASSDDYAIKLHLDQFSNGSFLDMWHGYDYKDIWAQRFKDEYPSLATIKDLWDRSIQLDATISSPS